MCMITLKVVLIFTKRERDFFRHSTSDMLPMDIWTMAEVLLPSHMDALGYKLSYELIDL